MRRNEATAWVVSSVYLVSLRLSQAKTLAALVGAAMRCQRVSLVGRQMLGTAKHQIKRCWRFCANDRIETADAMRGVVARLLKRRKKKLLVAPDWVDVRGFQTLMAAAVLKVRSVPVAWASTTNHVYDGHRSRNRFEESLLLVLRDMVPPAVRVVVLADRGFGRTALATFCQRHGFGYVVRVQPKVTVRLKGFHGKLLDYPVGKGVAKLKRVGYRADAAVTQNVVVRWPTNLPAKRDECLFLMTDQPGTAHLPAVRPADDGRAAVPGRQEQAERVGPAGHEGHHAGAVRPAAAGPGGRVPAPVRRGLGRQATVQAVGVVLDVAAYSRSGWSCWTGWTPPRRRRSRP